MNVGEALLAEIAVPGADAHIEDLGQGDLDKIRAFLDNDLYAFAIYICGYKDLIPTLHRDLSKWISLWGMVEVDGLGWKYYSQVDSNAKVLRDYRRIMTQIPREHFKTSLGTIANSLWQASRVDPDGVRGVFRPVAIFNERQDNATKWLRSIRDIVQSSKPYQLIYSDLIPPGVAHGDSRTLPRWWKWNDSEIDLAGKATGEVEASISAHGVESATTGGHWPKIIMDDLVSVKHQQSQVEMERTRAWVRNHVYLMRPAEGSLAYTNCTPWTYTDVYVDCCRDYNYKLYRRSALENSKGAPDIAQGQPIFPQKLSRDKLLEMYKRDNFSFNCTPVETPITMADWTTKPIALVCVGDKIVGMTDVEGNKFRKLVESEVLAIGQADAEVFEYETEDDNFVRCTEDHQWLRRARGYGPIGNYGCGGMGFPTRLGLVHDLKECPDEEAAIWLGGFFDGEGSVSGIQVNGHGGFITVAQSNRYPEINDRVSQVLDCLGFHWKAVRYTAEQQRARGVTSNYGLNMYRILEGRNAKAQFIRWCRPAKVKQILKTMFGGRGITKWSSLVARKSLGVQKVHWLQTTTGNYVAWGHLSRNSQMMCIPLAGAHQSFDKAWMRFGSIEADHRGEPTFIINREHYEISRTELEPRKGYEASPAPQQVPLHWMNKCLIMDPAPTEKNEQKNDPHARTAILACGIDSWGRRYILESWADRLGYEAIIDKIFELSIKWSISRIGIEEVNFSNVYRHWIAREQRRDGKYPDHYLQAFPLSPKGREKHARILAREPEWRQGLYYLNSEGTFSFQVEFVEYPNSQTVDLLDCMGYDKESLARPESPDEMAARRKIERQGANYSEPYFGTLEGY